MERGEVFQSVSQLISKAVDVPQASISEDSYFVADLDADSLDLLELVLSIRDEYGIKVSEGEVKGLLLELARFLPDVSINPTATEEEFADLTRKLTVGALVDFVAERLEESGAPQHTRT